MWRAVPVLVLATVITSNASVACAQRSRAGVDARVALVLRPFPGDMIRQRIEHDVDEQGTITMATGDSTVRVSTRTTVFLTSKVEAVDTVGAVVTSLVESVNVRATGGKDDSRRMRISNGMSLQGRTLRMKLAPDGGLIVLDDASGQNGATIATATLNLTSCSFIASPTICGCSLYGLARIQNLGFDAPFMTTMR